MASGDSFELFPPDPASAPQKGTPLAERMRPQRLDEVVGQKHLLGSKGALPPLLAAHTLPSLILWGPPGVGKTTIARLLAESIGALFEGLSGVEAGVKEARQAIEKARISRRKGLLTVLFLDEIHRLNRTQQDALLPHIETGVVTLIGATTENPSFEIIGPLLSRCRVFTLKPLDTEALTLLIKRALTDQERGLGQRQIRITEDAHRAVIETAAGDARRALGTLEAAAAVGPTQGDSVQTIDVDVIRRVVETRILVHDRDREEHYNVVSALIKSLRASDPDAALYYMARMLEAGEDPLFIARRLVIFASEDIGNADPTALPLATSAFLAVERIGLPEGRIPLAQAVTYLASAYKSNASYIALGRAQEAVKRLVNAPVPMHLRNAPTSLMREQGYGEGYQYPHDEPDTLVIRENLPEAIRGHTYYTPKKRGAEREIAERLDKWRTRRIDKSK